jgi:hypothetical protein
MKRRSIWFSSLAVLVGVLASGPAAAGEGVAFPDLGQTVPGHAGLTYLDLARMVVPDLAATGTGSAPVAMRHIEGEDAGDSPPQTSDIPLTAALDVMVGGKPRLLLLMDIKSAEGAQGYAPLALFDLAGQPKLLDVVNVASDRDTYFRDPARFAIADGDDVVETVSMHFNSNQSYAITELILLRGDRFEEIDSIPTLDDRDCGWEHTQQIGFEPRGATPYADIVATVTDALSPTGEACDTPPPPPFSRTVGVTYRWSGSRYETDSDAFARLAEENEKRF